MGHDAFDKSKKEGTHLFNSADCFGKKSSLNSTIIFLKP
jgi:hypothetical protein